RACVLGDDARDRRLADARRPMEDQRRSAILLDRPPQRRPRPEDVRLADELVQCPRPHPLREWRRLGLLLGAGVRAEVTHAASMLRPWRGMPSRTTPSRFSRAPRPPTTSAT